MQSVVFGENTQYNVALLVKHSAFNERELGNVYVDPMIKSGIPGNTVCAVSLSYNSSGKAPVKHVKAYLEDLMPLLKEQGIQYLYVADAAYFKVLSGKTKSEPYLGYAIPCAYKGFEHMTVVYGVNHKSLMYNPANEGKLKTSLDALIDTLGGSYVEPGKNIIKYARYPETITEIREALLSILDKPFLAVDVEAASLRHNEAGIGTISFAWNQHEGIAFAVDYVPYSVPVDGKYGYMKENVPVHTLLKEFFEHYIGRIRMQNCTYDAKILIYELWMQGDNTDNEALLQGLEVMSRNLDDTKIITYLATNSCAGNELGLKAQAQEFAGNWAQDDINDILKIPLPELLQYNLVDSLCTNYVYDKNYPIMVADNQEELYHGLMMESQQKIIQLELTGMPMDPDAVASTRDELETIKKEQLAIMYTFPIIHRLEAALQVDAMEKANAKLKTKQHPLSKFSNIRFNPNSNQQLQKLFYEYLSLPVIDLTDSKQPATGTKTVAKLINHCIDEKDVQLLEAITTYAKADKVLSAFIPAFEGAIQHGTDNTIHWLHGSFNLGGTKSGRLSSSNPNLQNIPSGSTYAKMVKQCFKAPKGWIMCGADFNSLEDYISALTTKDPNKLKVYLEGYDGHCLRAYSYWPDKFPDIENTVAGINSIKTLYEQLRSRSKNPTFALTYQGTWITLVKNLGFTETEAKAIEANYHELYKVSDQYVDDRLDQACVDGYVDVAFGLRLRTPLLKQTIRGNGFTSFAAEAEGRTAGNALGQSYGLLNNRAFNEFMDKVWASPYRNDIKPIALIHDAIYLIIRDDVRVVEWVNRELIKSMSWQELPEIQHDEVKIGAELDLFWPTWANAITLPNGASQADIRKKSHDAILEMQ